VNAPLNPASIPLAYTPITAAAGTESVATFSTTITHTATSAASPAVPQAPGNAPATAAPTSQWHVPAVSVTAATLNSAIPASVIGHEQDGGVVLQSPIGNIKLFTAHPLPTGTQILFSVDTKSAPRLAAGLSWLPPRFSEIVPLLSEWQTLEDALAHVSLNQPQLAQDVLTRVLAQPDNKLASSLLFFLSAIKGGDIRQLFGNKFLEALESTSPATAKKLAHEFGQLQNAMREPIAQNWTMYLIPMHQEQDFNQLRLFVRQEDEGESKKTSGGGQRFVLDITLSHMGDMQLDGFVRKSDSRKQFDLVLRTTTPWPQDVQQQIRSIYEAALASTGMLGMLQVQVGAQHFVRPLQDVSEASSENATQSGVLA